jgi:hypothetical protein
MSPEETDMGMSRVETRGADLVVTQATGHPDDQFEVTIPDEETEAMRDLERAREDAKKAERAARHQLTTDMTSIETRELSITKIIDFCAKTMREGLRSFIGRFNITQNFLDSLGTVVQGQLGFLTESGIIIGGDLNNIVQDEDTPDTVLIDVTLDVPYPCNYIRLTLVI